MSQARVQLEGERRPLLKHDDTEQEDERLDKFQLFLICFSRLVEPVAFFVESLSPAFSIPISHSKALQSIFPFVNQYVYECGIPREQTGFYVGLIESSFSFVQFLIMPLWGRLSDRRGRKPILVASLFGLAVTSTLFGISQNVWMMLTFRLLSGICSGSTVTLRTMTSEISAPKTQAKAFAAFALAGNISIFLAPLEGGLLAKPADRFPIFRHLALFVKYPYLLPCLVTGLISLTAAILDIFFLNETRVSREPGAKAEDIPTTKEILAAPGVKAVCFINWYTFATAFAYTALAPVFQFTLVSQGGYGLTPSQISYLLGCGGAGQFFWSVAFPSMHKRFGNVGIIRFASYGWPTMFIIYPLINFALRHGMSSVAFWTVSFTLAAFASLISASFTACQLCVNDISPSPAALGVLNGIVLSGTAASRAIAPAIINSIFTIGVEHRILYGQLAWLVLFVWALGYTVVVSYLPRKAWGLPEQVEAGDGA